MSVIFKTLKKLKTESTGAGKGTEGRAYRKTFFFNTARYSASSAFLLFVLLSILVAGTFFGYFKLHDKTDKKGTAFAISTADIRPSTASSFNSDSEKKAQQNLDSTNPLAQTSIEYRPPDTHPVNVKKNDPNASASVKKHFAALGNTAESSHIASKNRAGKTMKSSISQDSTAPDVKEIFLSNSKKNAKIARQVSDIKGAMDRGDNESVEKLFDELAVLKGQDNSYVLKLKAVWCMRRHAYEDAANLLKAVLSKNELDLEAGLNMAIIEIRTQKEQSACRRLEKLQKTYPDNVRLAEILKDLKEVFKADQPRHFSTQGGQG